MASHSPSADTYRCGPELQYNTRVSSFAAEQLVGELDELRDKDYADQPKRPGIKSIEEKQIASEFQVGAKYEI